MDWFEKLTGFHETDYEETRARLEVEGGSLRSRVNGARYGIGELELVSLQALRERAKSLGNLPGRLKTSVVTQGPACAIAAGAATIYRNYFAPAEGGRGQTAKRQLDGLADLGVALSSGTELPVGELWTMRNGYALATQIGLDAIGRYFGTLTEEQIDILRGKLRVGIHRDVEVTAATGPDRPQVSQSFCSALPVAYSRVPPGYWQPFASLVLEAAYEATIWAAVLNAQRDASNVVFLTLLGGGAFGNHSNWIYAAMRRALEMMRPFALDVRLVSYGSPSKEMLAFAEEFQ
jgi:hypothetical protein